MILPEESVVPNLDASITDNSSKIVITGMTQDRAVVASIAKESEEIHLDQLLSAYNTIIEKIEVVEEAIPYETITKDSSNSTSANGTKVIQNGVDGVKKVTYKVKYQNDIEIERVSVSEEIIKEPVDKIIQHTNVSTRKSEKVNREEAAEIINKSSSSLAASVKGITPTKKVLNASAYTASTCGKSPTSSGYGITSSGAKASPWYTVAAGKAYKVGTVIYIPYFKNKPNGGWFVVEDRGSAITNNKIDVYMNTYNECVQFGRRNLECYIYE